MSLLEKWSKKYKKSRKFGDKKGSPPSNFTLRNSDQSILSSFSVSYLDF